MTEALIPFHKCGARMNKQLEEKSGPTPYCEGRSGGVGVFGVGAGAGELEGGYFGVGARAGELEDGFGVAVAGNARAGVGELEAGLFGTGAGALLSFDVG
ncbi:Hypothetical predicted protein [Olea europaea subsp. europaea]|uniref:Uncharacterized protein n=1 Tax=Olea europaea subsp. europaea TaxID=158383 RepID=A0A8S0RYE9_OLEEU|nr:Hypothetical predicted protein [Olea europaea subsp. europaea]